jgi:DNA (cytosine-5)-methyltransferase 1
LQGFPKSYSFAPEGAPVHFKTMGRLIGNAVPVTLGKVIGQSISAHLGINSERAKPKKGRIADVARKPLVA